MLPLLSLRYTATGAEDEDARTGEANVSEAKVPPEKPPKTCGCDGVLPDPREREAEAEPTPEMQTEAVAHRRRLRVAPAVVVVPPRPRWHWGWWPLSWGYY